MLQDWRASLHTRCRFKREALDLLAKKVETLLSDSTEGMKKNATAKPNVCERCLGRAQTLLERKPDVDKVEYGKHREPPYFCLRRGGVAVVLNERQLVRDHLWLSVVFRGWLCKPCNNLLRDVDTRSTDAYRTFQRRVGRNCRTFPRDGDDGRAAKDAEGSDDDSEDAVMSDAEIVRCAGQLRRLSAKLKRSMKSAYPALEYDLKGNYRDFKDGQLATLLVEVSEDLEEGLIDLKRLREERSNKKDAKAIVDALREEYIDSSTGEMDWVALGKDGTGLFRAPPELNFFYGPVLGATEAAAPSPARSRRKRGRDTAKEAAPPKPRARPKRDRDSAKKAAPAKPRARPKRGRAATEDTAPPKKRAAAEEAARRLSSR